MAFQKARIQLFLLLLGMVILPIFVGLDYYLYGKFRGLIPVMIPVAMVILLFLIGLLRAGYGQASGHGMIVIMTGLIWYFMFTGTASVTARMDTIVLLLTALLMAPLLSDIRGLLIHYGINGLVLILFHIYNPVADQFTIAERRDYALDTTIGLMVSGYVCFLLIKTSQRARREIGRSNKNLQRKIRKRTAALNRSRAELEASRDEIRRDVEMARHVQSSILPGRPMLGPGWDLAFTFRPFAPVSGDFYDFYTRSDQLEGVGLFDVSGHGVASGLITVLAKSLLYRKFKGLPTASLSKILESANEELIRELRQAGNYLTGVLLRCGDGFVETVNAGHADVLLCDPEGFVEPLAKSDRSHRGTFLGLEFLAGEYPSLTSEVRGGDALLVYSDGLTDAQNSRQEAFGVDRLRAAFTASGGLSTAQERLDYIMNTIHDFRGEEPFNDDVTAVLLVKG